MRSQLLFVGALLCACVASAQAPATGATPPPAALTREPLPGRTNQKVERIEHEDAGSRIEERRYGGQTERITVQPKNGMPEYEVQPDASTGRPADTRDGPASAGGQRRWNVLRF